MERASPFNRVASAGRAEVCSLLHDAGYPGLGMPANWREIVSRELVWRVSSYFSTWRLYKPKSNS